MVENDRHPLRVLLDVEHATIAAGGDACGDSCACHGGIVCRRAAHPHDADQAAPHVGIAADGTLVQWVHTDEHGPVATVEQAATTLADVRRAHTVALLDSLDLEVLAAALERVNRKRQQQGRS